MGSVTVCWLLCPCLSDCLTWLGPRREAVDKPAGLLTGAAHHQLTSSSPQAITHTYVGVDSSDSPSAIITSAGCAADCIKSPANEAYLTKLSLLRLYPPPHESDLLYNNARRLFLASGGV